MTKFTAGRPRLSEEERFGPNKYIYIRHPFGYEIVEAVFEPDVIAWVSSDETHTVDVKVKYRSTGPVDETLLVDDIFDTGLERERPNPMVIYYFKLEVNGEPPEPEKVVIDRTGGGGPEPTRKASTAFLLSKPRLCRFARWIIRWCNMWQ